MRAMERKLVVGLAVLSLIIVWMVLGPLAVKVSDLILDVTKPEPMGDPIDDDPNPEPEFIGGVSVLGDPIDDDPNPEPEASTPIAP